MLSRSTVLITLGGLLQAVLGDFPGFDTIARSFDGRQKTLALDWETYKRLCDSPDVLSRWMLEQTIELLDGGARQALEAALDTEPLPKPSDHSAGATTDMFRLTLTQAQVLEVHSTVARAVAAGETTRATRRRGLGGFEEAWREYVVHLDTEHVL